MPRTPGISLARATIIMCLALSAALVAAVTQGSAEDVDSRWAIGAWTGTSPGPAGGSDMWELILAEDHSFTGYIDFRGGGIVGVSRTWQLTKVGLSLRGTYTGGPPVVKGSLFTFDLTKRGDALEGTQHRAFQPTEIPVSLARAR